METKFLARSRPSEPLAHLLVAALAAITVAGVAGSVLGVQHASTLLYWPVALVVAAVAFSFRPGHVQRACE
jgi:hypothetical protein